MLTYKASFKRVDQGGYHVEILDFPGAITCGHDLDHARRMARAVVVDMAETLILEGRSLPLPDPALSDPEADLQEPVDLVLRGRSRRDDGAEVRTRADLSDHVLRLAAEFENGQDQWENPDLPSFLGALGAWLDDCEGYYLHNNGGSLDPRRASWQLFADALSAATIYE